MRKRQINEMENAMSVADNVIDRIKNLKEYTVVRDVDSFPLCGVIPFDLKHEVGGPLQITVIAESQEEADRRADKWLAMED